MGLDISAYSNIKKLDCVYNADHEPIDPKTRKYLGGSWFRSYINPDFPAQAEGLEDQTVYSYGESFGFRAGAYSSYNRWREELAKLAGYPAVEREQFGVAQKRHDAGAWEAESGPFKELINFSDCEGVIGCKVATKLLKDFDSADISKADPYFKEKFAEFRKAFFLASQNGAVTFH